MNNRFRTRASSIALLGSLGLLTAGQSQAAVIFFEDNGFSVPNAGGPCGPTTRPPSPQSPPEAGRTSAVLSGFRVGNPLHDYGFTICNTSSEQALGPNEGVFLLRDWELPYDPLAQLVNITAPEGWNVSIETIGDPTRSTGWDGTASWLDPNDPFYDPRYLGLTQVIHFYTCEGVSECNGVSPAGQALAPPGSGEEEQGRPTWLGGFGFQSPFLPTNAPYQASWMENLPPRSGDPDYPAPLGFGPDSPGLRDVNDIPEPHGFALFVAALGAFLAGRTRRRKSRPG